MNDWRSTIVGLGMLCGMLCGQRVRAQCTSTSDGASLGCWQAIQPVCPVESLTCAFGFPRLQAIHAVLTYNANTRVPRVLMFSTTRPGNNCSGGGGAGVALWNPATYAGTWHHYDSDPGVPGRKDDSFCGSHVVLEDGRVLFVGGTYYPIGCSNYPQDQTDGHNGAWVFNSHNPGPGWRESQYWGSGCPTPPLPPNVPGEGFDEVASMNYERWYPTATLLPDGKVIVTSGTNCNDVTQAVPELYDPVNNTWTEITSGSNTRYAKDWYPWMHVRSNGKLWHAGPHRSTGATPLTESLTPGVAGTWSNFGPSQIHGGGSALYLAGGSGRVGQILKSGGPPYGGGSAYGGVGPTNAAAVLLEDSTRVATGAISVTRFHHTHTILADGSVLITGGNKNTGEGVQAAAYDTQVWRPGTTPPTTGTWTTLATAPNDRMYHSTALLLPDGRVLVMGGQFTTANVTTGRQSGDFFYPPYLYLDGSTDNLIAYNQRPSVSGAPTYIATGSSFTVNVTPGVGASSISKASLIRPGSVTHANNMEQRYVPLSFTPSSGNLTITAPATTREAPPGYYMLFFVDNATPQGHPSFAEFVRVWGVDNSSITYTVSQQCNGGGGGPNLTFNVAWKTTLKSTGADTLHIYSPGGTCGNGAGNPTVVMPPAGGSYSHQASRTFACQSGTWKLVAKSSEGGTTSKSLCTTVQVTCISCCPPPCDPIP